MDEGLLLDHLASLYDDQEVALAVVEHARELGTLPGMLRGEFTTPSRQDAHAWYRTEGHKRVRRTTDQGG